MSNYTGNRTPLPETAFRFLPLGSTKPTGWLRRQLRIQADGQAGRLPECFPDLGPNSGWLGGTGESWERGPYYLDGFVPLAFLLEDEEMIAKAHEWMNWMLESQDESGRFGPTALNDWWPLAVALKTLTQYQEVTGDPRVIPLMERFFRYMKERLPSDHLRDWGKHRWADMALSVVWLYNRNGDPELLELAAELMRQGYNWADHFMDFAHTRKQSDAWTMRTHVVNNTMAVKTPGVMYEISGWEEHKRAVQQTIDALEHYHGTAVGVITGDEHYAGKDPIQGSELCSVVEYMFSLEQLMELFGDPAFGDRLEKMTYNALPATFDRLMLAHQYDQQANQVLCTIDKRPWTNNFDDSNLFGLEPNYGCCTANFHQGWPKFAANLWMATADDGLAAVAYGPCVVNAKVSGGVDARIEVTTEYPFDETITMKLGLSAPSSFPLKLRIPAWAEGASVSVNGEAQAVEPGAFASIEREWSDGDIVEIVFPMRVEVERRFRNSVTLKRGPLVYSLKIGERWVKVRGEEPCPDYAVYPTTPWSYGLQIDPESPEVEVVKKGVGDVVFGPDDAPVELRVKGRLIAGWQMQENCAGPLPESPVRSSEPEETLTLIPYGCAKLRITEFPLIEQ